MFGETTTMLLYLLRVLAAMKTGQVITSYQPEYIGLGAGRLRIAYSLSRESHGSLLERISGHE